MADFALYGAAADLFSSTDREVLCESGARTGKTNSILVKAKHLVTNYPGTRGLFVRKTRASLSESVLPDFEGKILGYDHPSIGRLRRDQRGAYYFPRGSVIVLGGMDRPERFLSAEFDFFAYFQAEEETQQAAWDTLMSRLSGRAIGYTQGIADANPAHAQHWLINRAKEILCLLCATVVPQGHDECPKCHSTDLGRMRHLQYRLQDNPRWFNHATRTWRPEGRDLYINTLGRLRGVKRKRLRDHLWVSEEGQVLEDWDEDVHRISGHVEVDKYGVWKLHVIGTGWSENATDPMRKTPVTLRWFGAGGDFGFSPHPGVLQVWGVDDYGRSFRVVEIYQTHQQVQWWAERAAELYTEFQLDFIAMDPSANDLISAINSRICAKGGPAIAIGAENVLRRQTPDLAGIDLMRWGLRDPDGKVRTFFLRDAIRHGLDDVLKEAHRATRVEEEVPSWVFKRNKTTGQLEEKPDDTRDDHGLDAWRYFVGEAYGRRLEPSQRPKLMPQGSIGAILRHTEKMDKARKWREEHG